MTLASIAQKPMIMLVISIKNEAVTDLPPSTNTLLKRRRFDSGATNIPADNS